MTSEQVWHDLIYRKLQGSHTQYHTHTYTHTHTHTHRLIEPINSAELQDTMSTHKNQLCFYALTISKSEKKWTEQFHGNSLAVQLLGLLTFTVESRGSGPGCGTKIPGATWPKREQKKEENNVIHSSINKLVSYHMWFLNMIPNYWERQILWFWSLSSPSSNHNSVTY